MQMKLIHAASSFIVYLHIPTYLYFVLFFIGREIVVKNSTKYSVRSHSKNSADTK